jgi:hypothetical protein
MTPRFFYNAHAVALSGHLTLPFQEVIESQAPTALSTAGGFSSQTVQDFDHRGRGAITCKSASTHVTGSYSAKDHGYFTVIESKVEKLNLLGIVTIERLVGRLMSRHACKEKDPSQPYAAPEPDYVEPSSVPLGSAIEGLRIAGVPIDVKLIVPALCKHSTHTKLREEGAHLFGNGTLYGDPPKDANASIFGTMVESYSTGGQTITPENAPDYGFQLDGKDIVIEHFGRLRLAEILITPQSRRFVMFHAELGCATEGMVTAASGNGNGLPIPPRPSGA